MIRCGPLPERSRFRSGISFILGSMHVICTSLRQVGATIIPSPNFHTSHKSMLDAVLQFYDDPSKIAAMWTVQPSDRATPSARVSHVLAHIQGGPQGNGASHSLVASTKFKAGSVVFLYRGAALSSACVAEYEDHQPSVEVCNCVHNVLPRHCA